jgi:hypothetical protein
MAKPALLSDFSLFLLLRKKLTTGEIQQYFIVPGIFVQRALASEASESALSYDRRATPVQERAIRKMLKHSKSLRTKKDNP